VLVVAFLSMTIAASYQVRISEVRRKENQRLRQRLSEYETGVRRFGLTPADIEYLRWFQEFDRASRMMSKQQEDSICEALHSSEEDDLERVTADAMKQWREAESRFRQKSPPPACRSIAAAYSERLGLMAGQIHECVAMRMALSSQFYPEDSPQGRKWSKAPRIDWRRPNTNMDSLRVTTRQLNVALEQISRLPGTPLPQDLAKLRVGWEGVLLDL
jgi:hypothetical protein